MAKHKSNKKTIPKAFKEKIAVSYKNYSLGIPTTEKEVEIFEKNYGTTDFDLPEELGDSNSILEWGAEHYSKSLITNKTVENTQRKEKEKKIKGKKTIKLVSENSNAKKNDYFKKVVLAAEIAYQLHEEPTFGHKKFVKVFYICKEVCHMKLNTSFAQHAAGPLDSKLMYSIDKEFEEQKWFKKIKREKFGFKYEPLEKVESYKSYYSNYYKDQKEGIDRILTLLKKEKSDFCEKVATLFAVWKENLLKNEPIDEQTLYKRFYAWDDSKSRFTELELSNAIVWMRENEIVPTI